MNRSESGFCKIVPGGITLTLHIQPRASKNQLCGILGDKLKIRLTSPPVDGAANKMCVEYLAELFSVSKSCIEIISGETSRQKRVRISGDTTHLMDAFKRITSDLI